jgi:glycolate oxidase FAD binding subunit
MEPALTRLAERVRAAAADREALRIRAGGSKDFYGNAPHGTAIDPRELSGVISYQPTELALAVRSGTALAEVEALLGAQGQMLAFEPPHFGPSATVGGCIACALAGPRRTSAGYAYGGVRDFVLGARLLDGRGQLLSFGGMVMKNVAGYDVARLLCGSLGTLGVLTEISLKVVPRPASELTLELGMMQGPALAQLQVWAGQPLPVSASAWAAERLRVRLSGSGPAVEAAAAKLGGERMEPERAVAFWEGLREQTAAFFSGDAPLWRLSLPCTAPALEFDSPQLIEWGGAQRWVRGVRPADTLRARAMALGGHATLFRGGDRSSGVFTPPAPGIAAIQCRLRAQFDPAGVFDGGRLHADWHHADRAH